MLRYVILLLSFASFLFANIPHTIYDLAGNLITKTIDGIGTSYSYNENDQLVQQGSVTFTYDANGNMVSDGTNSYSYDDKNRLISLTTPTDTIEYSYDANDNRIAKTTNNGTTTYLIDTNTPYAQVITESKSDGTQIVYTYGNDLLNQNTDAQTLTYLTDALGSTRALADSAGNITDNYTYTPYGALLEHIGSSNNEFMFTGEQYGFESGNYYLRARYYNPATSRFLTRDSYDGRMNSPITQNHYLYANANPLTYVDPSGYMSMMSLSSSISIRGTLQTSTSRVWLSLNRRSIIEGFVGTGNNSLVTNLVINEVVNILVGREFRGPATTRGSRAHKFLEYKIASFRPLGQYVKLEVEVFVDKNGKKGARNGGGSIGIDILVKVRTGKNSYKPMVLIDLKTGTRTNPNSKNGFSLSRAKEHGRRHGNIPVIEVYIPFI